MAGKLLLTLQRFENLAAEAAGADNVEESERLRQKAATVRVKIQELSQDGNPPKNQGPHRKPQAQDQRPPPPEQQQPGGEGSSGSQTRPHEKIKRTTEKLIVTPAPCLGMLMSSSSFVSYSNGEPNTKFYPIAYDAALRDCGSGGTSATIPNSGTSPN